MIQMKVKVSYTKVVEDIIEVDDKFYKLTDSGGYEDLSYDERESLESGLMEEITNLVGIHYTEIYQATFADTDEIMLEI